jgi:hypothetical protein
MMTYFGVKLKLHAFLSLTLDGCEWPTPRSGLFNFGERAPGTDLIGDWMVPRLGLDAVAKRKNPCTYRELLVSHFTDSKYFDFIETARV